MGGLRSRGHLGRPRVQVAARALWGQPSAGPLARWGQFSTVSRDVIAAWTVWEFAVCHGIAEANDVYKLLLSSLSLLLLSIIFLQPYHDVGRSRADLLRSCCS